MRPKILFLLVILCLFQFILLHSGCRNKSSSSIPLITSAPDSIPQGTGSVEGMVTRAGIISSSALRGKPASEREDKEPVPQALVYCEEFPSISTFTDTDGRFILKNVPHGPVHIIAIKDEDGKIFSMRSPIVNIHINIKTVINNIEIVEAATSLSGVIRDAASSSPLSGVAVTVWGQKSTSDAFGRYSVFNMPPGTWDVKFEKNGYQTFITQISFGQNAESRFDLNMIPSQGRPDNPLTGLKIDTASVELFTGQNLNLLTLSVFAVYSDGSTIRITPEWSLKSGEGRLDRYIYTAGPNPGLVVLEGRYSEGNRSFTLQLLINVMYRTLESLSLSPSRVELMPGETYSLEKISVTANYENGFSSRVQPVWTLTGGDGELSGSLYRAPDFATTAVFIAIYSENGITRTATFKIQVGSPPKRTLVSLSLSKSADWVSAGGIYDLSNVKTIATYDDGSTDEVEAGWALTVGEGELSGLRYKAPLTPSTAVFVAIRNEEGTTRTATFRLSINGILSSLTLSPTSSEVFIDSVLDLSTIRAIAGYEDGTSVEVRPVWSIENGGGILDYPYYVAPPLPGHAVLTASYNRSGRKVTASFSVTIRPAFTGLLLARTEDITTTGSYYELHPLSPVALFSDGTRSPVSGVWTVKRGHGTLEGTTLRTGQNPGEIELEISHTINGVERKAYFILDVKPSLLSLELSKTLEILPPASTLDLGNIKATAKYSDGSSSIKIPSWILAEGSGTIDGSIYTSPSSAGVTILRAEYTELGIKKTATLSIRTTSLASLSLEPVFTSVAPGSELDLSSIKSRADYEDGSSLQVKPVWIIQTGPGTLSGSSYKAPSEEGEAILQASFSFGSETRSATLTVRITKLAEWLEANPQTPFAGRTDFAFTVHNGKMWVLGGYDPVRKVRLADVWYSSDGISWVAATGNAAWPARYGHTALSYNNRLWVISGSSGGRGNDVWWSADGATWNLATDSAAFSGRYGHASTVYNGRMWLSGGQDSSSAKYDVWWSTDGVTWTRSLNTEVWGQRRYHSMVEYDGKLWIIGGHSPWTGLLNDVWYSLDGTTWTRAVASAQFSHRQGHSVVVRDSRLWLLGGRDSAGSLNDIWFSTGGSSWTRAVSHAGFPARNQCAAMVHDGRIWVVGNDVWSSR